MMMIVNDAKIFDLELPNELELNSKTFVQILFFHFSSNLVAKMTYVKLSKHPGKTVLGEFGSPISHFFHFFNAANKFVKPKTSLI